MRILSILASYDQFQPAKVVGKAQDEWHGTVGRNVKNFLSLYLTSVLLSV
jgi:hypothetical protein